MTANNQNKTILPMSALSSPIQKILNFSVKLFVALFVVALLIFMFPEMAHHLILLIGAGMSVYSLRILKKYGDLQSWQLEKARIETLSEVTDEQTEGNSGAVKYYYPEIKYHYTVDEKTYTSKTVSLEKQNIWCAEKNVWGESLTENEKWWSALKVGYELSAYINPKNPAQSVLIKNISNTRRSHHLAILFGGILICFLWLLVVLLNF
ncbi:hypothetical protein GCM10009133_04710 [Cocleimonas flava]|uniref:Uncharacterized protein DUF3592 n=1 Tax=Cocleimonas flava TaxID=634765 RepID=A0A4R1F0R1_9GAMM|nr:DUF3592 domain-containing protein [Cocleimonas flava]TCJ86840.1 uncharacterized protein DUF3592 [Cocleimonas flava]